MTTRKQDYPNRRSPQKRRRSPAVVWMLVLLLVGGLLATGWLFFVKGWTISTSVPTLDLPVDEFPVQYEEYVTKYASLYDVDEALIYAVIKTESSFDPNAMSHQDAKGLMQVTGETFDWLGSKMGVQGEYQHDDLYDPDTGIQYGTFFLSYLLKEFGGVQEVAAAYHAGRGITNTWLGDPAYSTDGKTLDQIPYPATAHYVEKIKRNYEGYQKKFQN